MVLRETGAILLIIILMRMPTKEGRPEAPSSSKRTQGNKRLIVISLTPPCPLTSTLITNIFSFINKSSYLWRAFRAC